MSEFTDPLAAAKRSAVAGECELARRFVIDIVGNGHSLADAIDIVVTAHLGAAVAMHRSGAVSRGVAVDPAALHALVDRFLAAALVPCDGQTGLPLQTH